MPIPLVMLASMAAGLIADQAKKKKQRGLLDDEKREANADLYQSTLNAAAARQGGDTQAANVFSAGHDIDRGFAKQERELNDQPVNYGNALKLLGGGGDLLGDISGLAGLGGSTPSSLKGADESTLGGYAARERDLEDRAPGGKNEMIDNFLGADLTPPSLLDDDDEYGLNSRRFRL